MALIQPNRAYYPRVLILLEVIALTGKLALDILLFGARRWITYLLPSLAAWFPHSVPAYATVITNLISLVVCLTVFRLWVKQTSSPLVEQVRPEQIDMTGF